MKRTIACAQAILIVAGAGACGERGGAGAGVTVRDSAGVRIVENAAPAWAPGSEWRLASVRVRLGGGPDAGGDALYRVTGATRRQDGTTLVANAGASTIVRYSADGVSLGATGGRGEGPGEFRAIAWLSDWPGDSALVFDAGLSRFTMLAPGGEPARVFAVAAPQASEGPPIRLIPRGVLANGRIVLTRGGSFSPVNSQSGPQRQPLTVRLADADGTLTDSLGTFPGEAVDLRPAANGNGIIRTAIPFGVSTLVASASDAVYVADTGGWDIGVYDAATGGLQQRIRRPHEPVPVRPEDVEAWIESRLASLPPVEDIRAGMRASYERVTVPPVMPALQSLLIDGTGHLWVRAVTRPGEETALWSVFDATGRWLGDVAIPSSLEVFEIGPDWVLGLERDELDVESVVLYALEGRT